MTRSGKVISAIGHVWPGLAKPGKVWAGLDNNEIEGWSHVQPPKIYNGRELYYDVPFGNPQLYFRYGFQKQAHVEFQSPKLGGRPLILAEVFDLGTAANAYSLFSSTRLPQDQYRMIGSKMAAEMDDRLLFCKGQYLVDIEMYEYATAINQAVTDIAEHAKVIAAWEVSKITKTEMDKNRAFATANDITRPINGNEHRQMRKAVSFDQ